MECSLCRVRTMVRQVGETGVYFVCACGNRTQGTGKDRLIASGSRAARKQELYNTVISNAPFSRTMLRVGRQCPDCGLPYLTQVRVSDDETIIHVCECGYRTRVN